MSTHPLLTRLGLVAAVLSSALLAGGCRQDMHDQPKKKPQAASAFFKDGKAARNLVPGTIPHGPSDSYHSNDNRWLQEDEHFYAGKIGGKPADTFPMEVTSDLIARGQQRFAIHCMPCHGPLGDGNGMVVARGMKRPTSYHIERLQNSPPGYFYDVITNGFGAMYDLADRVKPEDRWAIVAYVRALQISQNTKLDDLNKDEQEKVRAPKTAQVAPAGHDKPAHGQSEKH